MAVKLNKRNQWIMTCLLIFVWLVGGIAVDREVMVIAGTVASVLWFLSAYIWTGKIVIPKAFIWFGLLVVVQALSLLWSNSLIVTLRQVLLLACGGLWWIGAASWKEVKGFPEAVWRAMVGVGIVFLGLWLIYSLTGWPQGVYGPSSLVVEASFYKNHNHLGDWWMMIMAGAVWSGGWWGVAPALAMILVSRSRSAVLGALAGVGYVAYAKDCFDKYKKELISIGVVLVMIFVIQGFGKLTLEDRDYYVQALAGLVRYPLGVGLGNFGDISKDPSFHWWGRDDLAMVVHNVLLEWLNGAGWLGLTGWVWLGVVSWKMGAAAGGESGRWRAVYWAMLINFLFDATYFVPTMWWAFMVAAGLAGKED